MIIWAVLLKLLGEKIECWFQKTTYKQHKGKQTWDKKKEQETEKKENKMWIKERKIPVTYKIVDQFYGKN